MAWAVEQNLLATKKIVLLMLANRVNSDTGKCVPKIKTLMQDCGLSESAVKVALRELTTLGLIKIHQRFYEGQQLPSQYELCLSEVGSEKHGGVFQKHQVGHQESTESGIESGIESKPLNPQKTPRASLAGEYEERFQKFWKAYPRKVGKDAAQKAFNKRKPDDKLLGDMLKAIEVHKTTEDWRKSEGQFIPHPATWLNQGRWMDEVAGMTKTSESSVGRFI